jgi:hypothetical protein
MLSFEECKKILNGKKQKYSDHQIKEISIFLWELAEMHAQQLVKQPDNENSSFNGPRFQR